MSAALAWEAAPENLGLSYFDSQFGVDAVKILPGEYRVTDHNLMLVTVLGSCVSACIRDPGAGCGGMNHFMLPDSELNSGVLSARYGSYAMEVLINDLIKGGAQRARMEAKVFGGGNVLRGFTVNQVGQRNAMFVRDYLAAEGIPIVAEDLGDVYPRKIYYFPRTGRVMVRKLSSAQGSIDLRQESAYRKQLSVQKSDGDVELFN